MFENRRWLVIPTSITGSVNFDQVIQASADKLRLSLDESKTFVKYDVTEITESYETYDLNPEDNTWVTQSYEAGVYGRPSIYSEEYDEYTHEQILNVLTGSEWADTGSLE